MDLIEINGDGIPEGMKRIALGPILAQHRKRYLLHTSIGDVLLKRITALEAEEATVEAMRSDPEFVGMVERAHYLGMRAQAVQLQGEEMEEYIEIGNRLAPFAKKLALKCIVDPKIQSIEEYDALRTALTSKEGGDLEQLLAQLSKTGLDGEVTSSALVVSQEYGIPLASDITAENMTAQQSAVLNQGIERKNERLKEIMDQARRGSG